MRDVALRAQKDKWLEPVAQRLFRAVHPNVVSVVALLVGLAAAGAVLHGAYLLGLLLWAANRILDGLDGVVARTHGKQSDFGGYLDLFLDYLVYLAVPIAFMAANFSSVVMWTGVGLLSAYVLNLLSWSTLSALLEKRSRQSSRRLTSVEMPGGLVEGAETIVFYALFYLLPGYVAYVFGIMAVAVLVTACQRLAWAYRHL